MKSATASIVLAFTALVWANPKPLPVADPEVGLAAAELQARQTSYDELKFGTCKDYTFIFARGSTEAGNMGTVIGPDLCRQMKLRLRDVACQGIGTEDGYPATLSANFWPDNTTPTAAAAAVRMLERAQSKCPNTKILVAGYSQGTAVVNNALQSVSSGLKDQVKGAALFGYTRNLQDNGAIPGYSQTRTKVYCNIGDLVCSGTLVITAAHLTYGTDADNAARFLASVADS